MKQIQFSQYGSAEVLQLVNTTWRQPGDGELLIKVEAIGVNYSDILRRRNTYFLPTPVPYVPGTEAVGTVEATGSGVDLQVGDRVLAILPGGGGYAEYVTAAAQYCVLMPPHIAAPDATAIFVQGTTAHLILHQVVSELAGQTIVVHAAAGGVGSLLVQMASQAGANVIATASSESKLARAKALGALAAVNYTQNDWVDQVIAANDGKKVDCILEMVGGEIFNQSFACLKPGGMLVVYGAASGEQGMIYSERLVDENHSVRSFNLAHFIENKTEQWQASLGAVIGLLAEQKISVQVKHHYPLADAAKAHQEIEDRRTVGKVVLVP